MRRRTPTRSPRPRRSGVTSRSARSTATASARSQATSPPGYSYELSYLDLTLKAGAIGLLLFLSFPLRLIVDALRLRRSAAYVPLAAALDRSAPLASSSASWPGSCSPARRTRTSSQPSASSRSSRWSRGSKRHHRQMGNARRPDPLRSSYFARLRRHLATRPRRSGPTRLHIGPSRSASRCGRARSVRLPPRRQPQLQECVRCRWSTPVR